MSKQEETHSLREWAQILAKNPDLSAESEKMCVPTDVQEAADHYAREWHDNKREMLPEPAKRGFIAGAAWQRNKHTPEDVQEAAENPEIIFSTDGELTIYSFVGAPRWWATIREAEEALSVFKAGMLAERERLMKEAPAADVVEMHGSTETGYPLVLTLGFQRMPRFELSGKPVRVIIEEIK